MTVLVKHSSDDWRLYHDDGTQIGTKVTARPNAATMADMLNDEYSGNSMLSTDKARQSYTDIVTENHTFIDKTEGQTEPWNQ